MAVQKIVFTMVSFLHNFFTVVWVGGLAFMVLTLFPAAKKSLGKTPQAQNLLTAVTQKHRSWVYISIVGLFVTGILLGKASPNQIGFMHFDSTYAVIASIKHILTFMMILIVVFRSVFFIRGNGTKANGNRFGKLPVLINFVLGIIVLVLSSMMAAI